MENKIKHLEMIQSVIERMGNYSFLIKGWSVTLVAAIIALTSRDIPKLFILLAFFPALIFWFLDGFYLWQERLFRSLYNQVCKAKENEVDFSMDTTGVLKEKVCGKPNTWIRAMFSRSVFTFHGGIISAIIAFIIIVLLASYLIV
jgi:hypothetical protein